MTHLMVTSLIVLVPFFLAVLTTILSGERSADARILPDHFVPGWEERRHVGQV